MASQIKLSVGLAEYADRDVGKVDVDPNLSSQPSEKLTIGCLCRRTSPNM